jgi:hypothetical protein
VDTATSRAWTKTYSLSLRIFQGVGPEPQPFLMSLSKRLKLQYMRDFTRSPKNSHVVPDMEKWVAV